MDDFIKEAMDDLSFVDHLRSSSFVDSSPNHHNHNNNNITDNNDNNKNNNSNILSSTNYINTSGSNLSLNKNESPRKTLALKEQEQWMDNLKKENFSLKLRVHFLEETLNSMGTYDFDALKQNVELKVSAENLKNEVKQKEQKIQSLQLELSSQKQEVQKHQAQLKKNHEPSDILQETVVRYRNEIETLEMSLSQAKAQIFDLNSQLAQRAVEIEHLRAQNESAQIQLQSSQQKSMSTSDLSMFGGQSTAGYDDAIPVANQQLEKGINLLRNQISDLKMQLIEKSAKTDKLLLELETRNKSHNMALGDMQDGWRRDEMKLKNQIQELRDQLARAKSENHQLTKQYEAIQRTHFSQESHLHIEIQDLEHQLQMKSEKLSNALQQIDKLTSEVKTMDSTLALKKSHIEQLSRQLESKNALVHTAEKDHLRTLDQMQSRITQLQHDLSESNVELQTKNAEIGLLKEQVDRQKNNINAIEERWAKQAKDITQQQRDIRQELEQQIQQFKSKTQGLSHQLQEKESLIKELQSQLEMQSIGTEESIRSHLQEKDRSRMELQNNQAEMENMKHDLLTWQHRLEEVEMAYKEAIANNDRLQSTIQSAEDRLNRQVQECNQKDVIIKQKDEEIRERMQSINSLSQRIKHGESALAEGQEVVNIIEERFTSQIEERNQLLIKVNRNLDQFLASNQIIPASNVMSTDSPAENFFVFSELLNDKCQKINQYPILIEQKVKLAESRMNEEMQTLYKRLDRKMEQMEKFEGIVRDAVAVQKKMRETLKQKHQELQESKLEVNKLESQLSLLNHELNTLKSEKTLKHSNERANQLEYEANIAELERMVRDKERSIRDDKIKITDLERALDDQKQTYDGRLADLNNHLRLLRQELERSQQQSRHYEQLLNERDNDEHSHLRHHPSAHSLLQASEAALEKLTRQYGEELNALRAQLDREHDKYKDLVMDYEKMRNELQVVRKRLAKRESMIEMALGKLEVVSHRKDTLENTVLNQFTQDVKKMMERSTSSYSGSLANLDTSRRNTDPSAGLNDNTMQFKANENNMNNWKSPDMTTSTDQIRTTTLTAQPGSQLFH